MQLNTVQLIPFYTVMTHIQFLGGTNDETYYKREWWQKQHQETENHINGKESKEVKSQDKIIQYCQLQPISCSSSLSKFLAPSHKMCL